MHPCSSHDSRVAASSTGACESGATSVEYGLVLAAIGFAFVVAGPMLWDAFLALLEAVLTGMVG